MSTKNRQRRAAKARRRAAEHGRPKRTPSPDTPPPPSASSHSPAFIALTKAILDSVDGRPRPADVEQLARHPVEEQQRAVDTLLSAWVSRLIARSWTPSDIAEIVRRHAGEPAVALVLGLVAAETAQHDPATVAPEWRAQLTGVEPATGVSVWVSRSGLVWPDARAELLGLMIAIAFLPELEVVMSPPGSWRPVAGPARGVDERMLAKVRALLAKAESTEFDEEAEALTAKAQQLMTEHAIDRAMADAGDSAGPAPSVRRLWLDAPYVDAKAALVNTVANHNRARCVSSRLGYVTLVGFASDLDAIELLSTSLLVQATRAMRLAGRQVSRAGTSHTRSFRRAFLLAYGRRIGERLADAAAGAESQADIARGGSLLPVLAAREQVVSDYVDTLFPKLVTRSVSISNAAGWGAGRAAADLARLNAHDEIERTG